MSEDCLSLNIFVPDATIQTAGSSTAPTPVLFWIHGGAFSNGEGHRSPVQYLAAFGNIIIVTINFRLGPLGFLSTGDDEAPGNFGLWDQRLALQWVKTNIRAFGGDPDKITVMGAASGGACVTFHAMYPSNQGLFQRIFVASGSALAVPTYHENARQYAKTLAKQVGCTAMSSSEIVSCLRQKSFDDIIAADVPATGSFDLPWTPVVDGDYIQSVPINAVTWPPSDADLSLLRSVDAMFGSCSADGSAHVWTWMEDMAQELNVNLKLGVTEDLFDMTVEEVLSAHDQKWKPLTKDAVLYEYTAWEDPEDLYALGQSTVDLTTDKHFFIPSVLFSRNHAVNNDQTNVYLFQFNEPKPGENKYPWIKGTTHGRFNAYALGMPEERWKTEVDLNNESHMKLWQLSKEVMTYWSNFVKTGDPNSPAAVGEHWLPFDLQDEYCLYLDADDISARKRCNAQRTQFWLEFLPQISAAVAQD
nr:hypothetical protein BaRGS_009296 [Batillaria attramentaria]